MTVEIFTHFLPIYPMRASLVGTQSPTILTQVCRRWRNIAISVPQLWRAIRLDLGTEFQSHQINLLRSWLQRSETRLLSVGIACNGLPSLLIEPHVELFLQELMFHRKRWEYVEIELPFDVVPLMQGELPSLRVLTITRSQTALHAL